MRGNRKHGCAMHRGKTPEYQIWVQMRQRCNNPHHKDYKYYGARGISVCDRWKNFSFFLSDMGVKPQGFSIDRIDNDGNYEPCNCRWVSQREQTRNSRKNTFLEYQGLRLTISEWAEKLGVRPSTLSYRVINVWDIEAILTRPIGRWI